MLFSELGLPTFRQGDPDGERARSQSASPLVEEQDVAHYTGRALARLRQAGCIGAMLWLRGLRPHTWRDPPLDESVHERYFGLWRPDGSAKPAVPVIAAFSGAERLDAPDDWIDIDRDHFWERPGV